MSESTLSEYYASLMNQMCSLAGMGFDYSALSATEKSRMESCLTSGLRQFYFHEPISLRGGAPTIHKWSFLEPVTTLSINAYYDTGSIDITNGGTTVTNHADGADPPGTWPTWIDSDAELLYDGVYYPIASRTDVDEIELASAWAPATLDEETDWKVVRRKYALPDDFGFMSGPLTYPENVYHNPIKVIGESQIREMENTLVATGYPTYAAVRPKSSDMSDGQRLELVFHPASQIATTLTYKYAILPNALVETTGEYPYGGAMHAETILESCLAVVEQRYLGGRGEHYARFMERLRASIIYDLHNAPEYLKLPADKWSLHGTHYAYQRSASVTYNGTEY